MDAPVALASVVGSALVALSGVWLTYWSGREQRRHEGRLAYEGRVWEDKSSALFRLITTTRRLLDLLREESHDARSPLLGVQVARTLDDLDDLLPAVEAYASDACRSAFASLRQILRDADADTIAPVYVEIAREKKTAAIDAQDFKGAAAARDREVQLLRSATDALNLDRQDAAQRAERLLAAARDNVRGQ